MLRSLYIAGTAMLVQRKKMDVVTNNIVNVETAGFKKDQLISRSFQDMMIERIHDPAIVNRSNVIGEQNTGIHIDEVITSFDQGNVEQTDKLTDIALEGPGFYAIATPNGERYTRDGSFEVSTQGYLCTSDGNALQGEKGLVYVGQGAFSVDSTGNVSVSGSIVNKIRVVNFQDLAGLRKEGNNLYVNYTNQAAVPATECTLKQSSLEGSNVDIAQGMVEMIEVSRTYEANQRVLKMIDESLGKTVNDVGRV